MPQKSPDTIHILEGKATLFQRPTTPVWHVRYRVHGKWERTSTKCSELADARQRAVELVTEAWFRERHSLPVVNKRFKSVARLVQTWAGYSWVVALVGYLLMPVLAG
jgi:hypothetical protein